MARKRIAERVGGGQVLVSDGAWGTFLQKKGLQPGDCPELWCIDRSADVADVARAYIAAGADMVESNSFGGSPIKLADYGLSARAAEINEAAARLSREAAGPDRHVIASIGPTGKMLMLGDVTEAEVFDGFAVQAEALACGGADALCIETMTAADEAALAVRAARETTKAEVICTFTFDRIASGEYRTMMGLSPVDAARAALEAGAHMVGTNCGNGMAGMIDIVREMRAAFPGVPILVHANAGLPTVVNGVNTWPEGPADMAGRVAALVEAGAGIVGGCCGTTPDHIRAIRAAVDRLPAARPVR
ncbi:MAG: methionine synthase [Verrucomicrobia bacterium A1]|nr:MAG: methionine synthase [Verrucomicrobia bacterium A1]